MNNLKKSCENIDKLIQFSKIQKESYPCEIVQTLEIIRNQILETKQIGLVQSSIKDYLKKFR